MQPGGYGYGYGYPGSFGQLPVVPAKPRDRSRTVLRAGLIVALVVAVLCGGSDAVLLAQRHSNRTATFVEGAGQATGALNALLQRRSAAVLANNEQAFLADVDQSRPTFVEHEKEEFANLEALGLSSFSMAVSGLNKYSLANADPALVASFDWGLLPVAVTIKYAVKDVDTQPVGAPWIPVVGQRDGHWYIADEMTKGANLPEGVGGQPWETGPVVVRRSAHVVAVISKDDERLAPQLMQFAETGVTNALNFLPTGWSGKVLVTAVSDSDVIASYFRDDMEELNSVAAVAVQAFDGVYNWGSVKYVTSRVLFNPDSLGGDQAELQMTLTHEFIHVATGPVTADDTPLWLVEGIAEYVAKDTGHVSDSELHYELLHLGYPTELPDDKTFYSVGYPNYLYSSQACRYIANKYGKAKLLALYTYFNHSSDEETAVESTLGVTEQQLTTGWLAFLHSLK